LTIELILAEGLGRRVRITLRGLGVERTFMNFLLEALVMTDLSLLLVSEGGRLLQVRMRLQLVRIEFSRRSLSTHREKISWLGLELN
jgi:hypothetical protein